MILSLASATQASLAQSDPQAVQFPGADGVRLDGALYMPAGKGPFPAVVALHGCAGLTTKDGSLSARHRDWGERLAEQGFIVLLPDSYGSRGMGPQCRNAEREVRPSRERVSDAKAALAYLAGLQQVKKNAISLLGWSNGGSSVLYAAAQQNAPSQQPDFARAVAFYPGCRLPAESGTWHTRLSLLILIGAADDWTPAAPCISLASDARRAKEPVEIVTYPGAYHDFDHPNLEVHVVRHLAFTGSGTGMAHTGTNKAARADAISRVLAYLAR